MALNLHDGEENQDGFNQKPLSGDLSQALQDGQVDGIIAAVDAQLFRNNEYNLKELLNAVRTFLGGLKNGKKDRESYENAMAHYEILLNGNKNVFLGGTGATKIEGDFRMGTNSFGPPEKTYESSKTMVDIFIQQVISFYEGISMDEAEQKVTLMKEKGEKNKAAARKIGPSFNNSWDQPGFPFNGDGGFPWEKAGAGAGDGYKESYTKSQNKSVTINKNDGGVRFDAKLFSDYVSDAKNNTRNDLEKAGSDIPGGGNINGYRVRHGRIKYEGQDAYYMRVNNDIVVEKGSVLFYQCV